MQPTASRPPAARKGTIRGLRSLCPAGADHHLRHGHAALARRLAAHLGLDYVGEAEGCGCLASCYLVPRETLHGPEWRPQAPGRFFGGWTPRPFAASKAIVHPALPKPRRLPPDWPESFGHLVSRLTLRGWTVFDPQDAEIAALSLLRDGAIRLKPVAADGGRGQVVVREAGELAHALSQLPEGTCEQGLVVEEDLAQLVTLSIGQAELPGQAIAYVGRQETTTDNRGRTAYGGSQLLSIRGDLDRLLRRAPPAMARPAIAPAIARAARFDALALGRLGGLVASRRNYDVAIGVDHRGRPRIGVLEQSWRIGGASGAEILAFEALAAHPGASAVRSSTRETYGAGLRPDPSDFVIYDGEDPRLGPLSKTARLEAIIED